MSANQSADTIINPTLPSPPQAEKEKTSGSESMSTTTNPQLDQDDQGGYVTTPVGNSSSEEDVNSKLGAFATYWRLLRFASARDRVIFVCAAIAACGSGACLPLMSLIFGDFTNISTRFMQQGDNVAEFRSQLNRTTLWFVYLFIGKVVSSYIFMHGFNYVSINISRSLRTACLKAALRQDLTFFDKNGPGTIAVRLTTDANLIKTGLSEKLGIAIRSIAVMITALVLALTANWKLALVCFSGLPAIFLVLGSVVTPEARIDHRQSGLNTKAAEVAEETFSSMRNVVAFNASEKLETKYNDWLLAAQKEGLKKSWLMTILWGCEYFCSYSIVALSMFYGMKLLAGGELSGPGSIIVVQFSVVMVVQTMNALLLQVQVFAKAISSSRTIFNILDHTPSIATDCDGHIPSNLDGDITLRNIDFRYPTRPAAQVLNTLSLRCEAGKVTALVGPSGSGKSTIVGLIERWYDPEQGSICLDGADIKTLNLRWLRQQIGIVQQEPVLFNDTVFNNVANGLIGTPYEDLPINEKRPLVESACIQANAHDFITRLANGYDSMVGERAGLLSGGQKQRIAIARSIVSNPRILILDEATSALDASSEDIVQDALDKAAQGRTTIVIAHKLATVKNADKIIVLDRGQVVEQGTHEYLIAQGGVYSQLASVQDLGAVNVTDNSKGNSLDKEMPKISEKGDIGQQPDLVNCELDSEGSSDSIDPTKKRRLSLLSCLYILFGEQKSQALRFFVVFLACVLAGLTYMGEALIFGKFIKLFEDQDLSYEEGGRYVGLLFFILALGNLICYGVMAYQANVLGQNLTRQYRFEWFHHTLKQDLSYFDLPGHSSGAISTKITQSATDLQNLLGLNIAIILMTITSVLSTTILPLAIGWKLALVSIFGTLPLIFLAGYFQMQVDMKLQDTTSELFTDSAGYAAEAISAIKTVNSLTMEAFVLGRYEGRMKGIQIQALKAAGPSMALYALSDSVNLLGMALVFWYGGRLVASGEYTTYQYFVIIMAVVFGGQASGQIFGFTTDMNKGYSAANDLIHLRNSVPEINGSTGAEPDSDNENGKIALENIRFVYPTRPKIPTLNGISLDIPSGKFIALVGGSGSGKSTVIALLERFYDINQGTITTNGQELRNLDPWKHRKRLALVQQEPTLYQGSLKENIELGSTEPVTEKDIIDACKQANIWEFVTSLPEGLNTLVGARGGSLSGGQKQRVAIARALIRKPEVLLLDEATSALDTTSEMIVQAALMEAAKSRTTIAVAHRLSTIVRADCIFVIENGRVVESGKHEELKALGGKYAKLVLMQALDHST